MQHFEGNSQAYQKVFHQLQVNRNPGKHQSRYNRNKVSLVLVKSSISVVIPLAYGHSLHRTAPHGRSLPMFRNRSAHHAVAYK